MTEPRGVSRLYLEEISTWADLYEQLRANGLSRTAELIEEWQDEWLPEASQLPDCKKETR